MTLLVAAGAHSGVVTTLQNREKGTGKMWAKRECLLICCKGVQKRTNRLRSG